MGLREQNARRTRNAIADVALDLFERHGYDATTMEQIAEAADIGTSTLYRYFPTKDSTLLEHPVFAAQPIASHLSGRPAEEPIAAALGHALASYLAGMDANIAAVARIRLQIDRAPTVRARVWDFWARQEALLEQAIADRASSLSGLPVQVSAHLVMMIVQMALDQARSTVSPEPLAGHAQRVLDLLSGGDVLLPEMP